MNGFSVLILLILFVGGMSALVAPVNTAGITVMHNGVPVDNLAVSAIYSGNNGPFLTGTTDGTGTLIVHTNLGNLQNKVLYDFSINGTGYSFSGPENGMITVSV